MSVLSEKPAPKYNKNPKMKPHVIDNICIALDFVWSVIGKNAMKIPPQAEDLFDKNARAIVALVWTIMQRFIKLGDDEDVMTPKETLLMWLKQKTQGYEGVAIENLTSSFDNGKALCALIHRHRPALIDYDALTNDGVKNVEIAMEAAVKYFEHDKFITAEEFMTLDEKLMTVYIVEYYMGIAEMRKLDLAAKSIHKVVVFTKVNDELKEQFKGEVEKFKTRLESVKAVLNDRTVDNTMAGAEAKLQQFYDYKRDDKGHLIEGQLMLESLYNQIAMRLSTNNRPAFSVEGFTLKDVETEMNLLEKTEAERAIALHAEINRQNKLVAIHATHAVKEGKLQAWLATKKDSLQAMKDLVVDSVSQAELQLRLLASFEAEFEAIKADGIPDLKSVGAELQAESFEKMEEVTASEANIDALAVSLEELKTALQPVLDDHLKRETFRAKINLDVRQQAARATDCETWAQNKEETLKAVPDAYPNVASAAQQLSELDAHTESKVNADAELTKTVEAGVAAAEAKYDSEYSTWTHPEAEEIKARGQTMIERYAALSELMTSTRTIVDTAHTLEVSKEEARLAFANQALSLVRHARDAKDLCATATFGYTLDEVRNAKTGLDESDAKIAADSAAANTAVEEAQAKLTELNVTENVYTEHTTESLAALLAETTSATEGRQAAYTAQLEKLEAEDAACKEAAAAAEAFVAFVADKKDTISGGEGILEDQLVFVKAQQENLDPSAAGLSAVESAETKLEELKVVFNPHSALTCKDCQVQWEQFASFLERKAQMLSDEIETVKMRGVSAEQMAEFEATFSAFDADNSQNIDKKELKACMYAIGEEKTRAEIDAIVTKYGADGELSLEAFKEMMANEVGVTAGKDDILAAFSLINKTAETAVPELMEAVMAPEDLTYFNETQPDGNYTAWSDDVFSR
eukprot:TRINITY_DN1774_c0_g1_i1.p1 TRINITY_DN1774_c0_g1~~TRINITY_DN1774_c0_g1_i1.p1  ORF type:complete len:923 (+),score=445.91 TRINITY_DN1774_c0_g1_i1:202-2970(+)